MVSVARTLGFIFSMSKLMSIQQSRKIMINAATHVLSAALILVSANTAAQVDTGGGAGGTGARRESQPADPTASSSNTDCTKANSIGIIEIKDKTTQQILRRDYACRGQIIESTSSQIIELYFRTGEKVIVLENSAIVVE
jgi:hypothetical protein